MITSLKPNQVFVFGSNLAGRHGKGAAKQALQWGAVYGKGVGHYGQTYAIPTKNHRVQSMNLEDIETCVREFMNYASKHSELEFLLTAIGCGLAGYMPHQIARMFHGAPSNVIQPPEFYPYRRIL